ncbi:myosin-6 [Heracleum sosnowskyi]|uniref:Myosin-6 n=1 Tax=Heracleum sosnowskyi TaxID=360622 RepID=A0AAD8I6U8_9APIA|nr:myosin-6 [Heracleum sosnowskyi]
MSASKTVVVGSQVWVEDPDIAWKAGEVEAVKDQEITVNCTSGGTVVCKISTVYPQDPEFPEAGVDDMTKLTYLHEPGVLQNISFRYNLNEIYTYTGSILIAVNPFQRLPQLYDKDVMKKYRGASLHELSPHPFAIADTAYRQMINEGISQAILVSGESGAGKTESTKMLMQYLAFMGGKSESDERSVEQQVLESNPVLEAFGNAKTVRNNNSSRFGKFVELQFNARGRISGAAIRTYLLERSRVCQVSDPERNYHCFYMLCAAPPEDVERYKLKNPQKYHYLNQSNCVELEAMDDSQGYLETRRAMNVVGIESAEQEAIFRVIASILHLGNIEFKKGSDADSSEPKDDDSRFHLKTTAELLKCDEQALEDSLCKRVMVTRDDTITKFLDPGSAAVSRDALAKIVYSRLFDWIVNKINNSIGQDPESKYLIGVLDIYGFESFKTNSFEQFCINLTNEKLQQHFNQHVFKMEQEEYTKEDIDWSYIEFVDNQDILDLIEKKPGGVIALLDEACMFPKSTNETFAQKLYQTFSNHKRFGKPKLSQTDFTIYHYAGDVTYQTDYFLDKNKDYVIGEHQSLLSNSKCPFVSGLFPPLPEESSNKSKFSSIATQFKQQLQSLLEILNATEPHYVRCVKPNNLLKPGIFENHNVLNQLRCGGVMEAIRISCAGFPTRKPFYEFVERFKILAPNVLSGSNDERASSEKLLEKMGIKGYQIGKTKLFLKAGQMAELDALRTEFLGKSATTIQSKYRSYYARRTYLTFLVSTIEIQAYCRVRLAHQMYERRKREVACVRIQKEIRGSFSRRSYKKMQLSAIHIQAGMRGMSTRQDFYVKRKHNAATVIQSHHRKKQARKQFLMLKKAAIVTQCAWKVRMARSELKKLKTAAEEAGIAQAAKDKLEKEVQEAKLRMQQEEHMREEAKTEDPKTEDPKTEDPKTEDPKTEVPKTEDPKTEVPKTEDAAGDDKELSDSELSDSELVKKLKTQNKDLKSRVDSLEKQRMDAETMIIQLKTDKQRLEEKLSDIEAADHILRQQSLRKQPSQDQGTPLPIKKFGTDSDDQLRKSIMEKQRENVDTLIRCVANKIGFSEDKPIAAVIIFRCLLQWKSFESERTSVFDRLIQMIGSAIENEDDNNHMVYWLSNTSTLLILIERSLKSSKPPQPTSFFGRMTQTFRSSSANLEVMQQIEAKYPALLFKQQLTAYVEKIYGIVRENLKKELVSPLACCIQAPNMQSDTEPSPWKEIVNCLNSFLDTLQINRVHPVLMQKMCTQTFTHINVQLFNSLLVDEKSCTFTNGYLVTAGLAKLEVWCNQATEAYAGSSWDELKHLRQAVEFLAIKEKSKITYDELTNNICSALSVPQLHRICTFIYSDNEDGTACVSPEVIANMKEVMTTKDSEEETDTTNLNSYLLDDLSSIPVSMDEISNLMKVKNIHTVKPPPELLEKEAFLFLKE